MRLCFQIVLRRLRVLVNGCWLVSVAALCCGLFLLSLSAFLIVFPLLFRFNFNSAASKAPIATSPRESAVSALLSNASARRLGTRPVQVCCCLQTRNPRFVLSLFVFCLSCLCCSGVLGQSVVVVGFVLCRCMANLRNSPIQSSLACAFTRSGTASCCQCA